MAFYNAGLFMVLFLSLFMVLLISRRLQVRGARPMLLLLGGMSLWSVCQLLHIYVVDPAAKLFWFQAKFAGIVWIPVGFFTVSLELYRGSRPVNPKLLGLLAVVPVLTLAAVATDGWLHLFRKTIEYIIADPFILIRSTDGPAFWFFTVYSYSLILASLYLLFQKARASTGTDRRQALLMLLGASLPWTINIVFLFLMDPVWPVDMTPLFLLFTEAVFLVSLFYYRMFNIVPLTKKAVFESLDDLILVVDLKGRIQDANRAAAEVLDLGREFVGTPLEPHLGHLSPAPGGDLAQISGLFRGTRDGLPRDYQGDVQTIPGRDRKPVGYLLVFRDITVEMETKRALEAATEELALQNRNRVRFMKQINRNVRLPMNNILGFADALAQRGLDPERQEVVRHIQISGAHLLKLVNDVLDYARIESGHIEIAEEPVHLFDLMRHITRHAEYAVADRPVEIREVISEEVPKVVMSDPFRLTQLLGNLMNNAIKFTEQGTVALGLKRPNPGWLEFSVADTGIGMTEAQLERLFQPFVQATEETAAKFGGTGLGLAIVKELTERMGGSVRVESAIGAGTCFRLLLPCRESYGAAPVYTASTLEEYRSWPMTVRLVTASGDQHELMKLFFEDWSGVRLEWDPEGTLTAAGDVGWNVLMVDLDRWEPHSEVLGRSVCMNRAAGHRSFVLGFTADVDCLLRHQSGKGIADDCILLPIGFEKLNRTLRRWILEVGREGESVGR